MCELHNLNPRQAHKTNILVCLKFITPTVAKQRKTIPQQRISDELNTSGYIEAITKLAHPVSLNGNLETSNDEFIYE